MCDLFNVHSAILAGHDHGAGCRAIQNNADVQLTGDVGSFFHQNGFDFFTFRAGLMSNQLHAKNLPGGFAHGDYLRTGAIAQFSPVMQAVKAFADAGGPVLGICNGFQVLTEAGLLPGALRPNESLSFVCRDVALDVAATASPFTTRCAGRSRLRIPVKHGDGRYVPPPDLDPAQVVLRYLDKLAARVRA